MNQQQEPSGLYKSISKLGNILGFVVMVMATPIVFGMAKRPMFSYFIKSWGRDIAEILVWVMGAVEAYLIFMAASFAVTGLILWAVTALVMRRFKD